MSGVIDAPGTAPAPPVIAVEAGLPGFPAAKHFVLVQWGEDDSPFSVLRCLEIDDLQFVVVPPEVFFPDYTPEVDTDTAQRLGLSGPADALVLVLLTLGDHASDATANLLGPLVINPRTLHGAQVVQAGSDHSARTPIKRS